MTKVQGQRFKVQDSEFDLEPFIPMPKIDIEVNCPVFDSFRVRQVGGMFDVPPAKRASQRFGVEVPDGVLEEDDWQIGLIVGPSGSGKSTIARAMFGDRVYRPRQWPADRAVIDGFEGGTGLASGTQRPTKEITRMLTAVGFSSPPSWIKPYHVLSGGEQFRCDLARALMRNDECGTMNDESTNDLESASSIHHSSFIIHHFPLVVFDEFTSVVDRNVARVVSATISKGIRSGRIGCRLVAVTCHYDVTEWLTPDWVIDMATSDFSRRRLRRPPIELELFRCRRGAWRLFAKHHYLSGKLAPFARCFLALWEGEPVAFCATLNLIGRKNRWRISRVVTLPDYQGIGIGTAVVEAVADLHRREGHRVNVTASHPSMIAHCRRSPLWRVVNVQKTGSRRMRGFVENYRGSTGRAVVSFEYVGMRGEGREVRDSGFGISDL
ncbi:MAG: GNAT family N-acetyltransferase [Planctomycetes bacterium]|nr:GNAT family N-acetyltransferase [Planctomycetota bacterium]MCG2685522.1 GNAT family N-acetyltransferase [Planctomycetales bacterium]